MPKFSPATYFKDDNGYWGYFYRVQQLDGSWKQKRVRGKRLGLSKKGLAIDHYNEMIKNGTISSSNRITFDTVSSNYLKHYEKTVIRSTFEREERVIKRLSDFWGKADLHTTTPLQIQDYYTDIYDKWSESELSKIHGTFKKVFLHAQQYYGVINDPFKFIKRKKKKENKEEKINIHWQLEEFKAVDNYIDNKLSIAEKERDIDDYKNKIYLELLRDKAIINILFLAGLRKGEMLSLKDDDLRKEIVDNKKRYYIDVTKTQTRDNRVKGNYVIKDTTKTGTNRRIYIVEKLSNLLLKLIKEHKKLYGYDKKKFDLISAYGIALSRNRVNDVITRYAKKAKVKVVTPHKMRMSFGSLLLNNGEDIVIVSQLLGHADIKTTIEYYIDIYDKRMQESADLLESIIK